MKRHIVILGGGIAGVEAAIRMRKYNYQVTLVSDRDFLFIYPISIWIPFGIRRFDQASIPLIKLGTKHGFQVVIDEFEDIDIQNNTVQFKSSALSYDFLILAIGMGKLKPAGIENTFSICGQPEQSLAIKKRLNELVEKGHGRIAIGFGGNPKDKSAVRGGPAFEMLFNFSTFLKRKGIRDQFEITLFAPMPEPGKRMGANAIAKMPAYFKRYGIQTKIGSKITAFIKGEIRFEDGSHLESDLTLFIPGGNGHPKMKEAGLPTNEAGFVRIDDHCKVEGIDNIYAVGDVAALGGPEWAAKQGHTAEIMAQVAVYNIHQTIRGSEKRRGYIRHLNILCIMDSGDGAAIVYRKDKKSMMIPLPLVGHWVKQGWGFYFRNTKLG
ncbi:MAG: FAD-dependent oxidoreductase, partial [bacterium]